MIKFENTDVYGWEAAIRGMRNPKNSWNRSDSKWKCNCDNYDCGEFIIGPNDHKLMMTLAKAGSEHRKYLRMINVTVDITAPLYWWKEFDTYKVGTVANSCSTMHKIADKEFTLDDFSHEHLLNSNSPELNIGILYKNNQDPTYILSVFIDALNLYREIYLETKEKKYWWQMIQLLPSSYNQKRTVQMNYETLSAIYRQRKDHKLDEWSKNIDILEDGSKMTNCWLPNGEMYVGFCDWIRELPYSELITHEKED